MPSDVANFFPGREWGDPLRISSPSLGGAETLQGQPCALLPESPQERSGGVCVTLSQDCILSERVGSKLMSEVFRFRFIGFKISFSYFQLFFIFRYIS